MILYHVTVKFCLEKKNSTIFTISLLSHFLSCVRRYGDLYCIGEIYSTGRYLAVLSEIFVQQKKKNYLSYNNNMHEN